MTLIKGIYAASMSVINNDLTLDVTKTIKHAEMIIDQGCHGVAIFGSTGQAQLISISEKINLFNQLSTSKYKEKYIIGTGLNSLSETINLIGVARSLNFKKFLKFKDLATLIRLIVSLKEFKPVPIIYLSLYILVDT